MLLGFIRSTSISEYSGPMLTILKEQLLAEYVRWYKAFVLAWDANEKAQIQPFPNR